MTHRATFGYQRHKRSAESRHKRRYGKEKEKARKDITGQDKGSQRHEKTRPGKIKEGREDQDKTRQVTSREMVPRKGDATLHVATNSQKVFRNRCRPEAQEDMSHKL